VPANTIGKIANYRWIGLGEAGEKLGFRALIHRIPISVLRYRTTECTRIVPIFESDEHLLPLSLSIRNLHSNVPSVGLKVLTLTGYPDAMDFNFTGFGLVCHCSFPRFWQSSARPVLAYLRLTARVFALMVELRP
jgi:hypothetical protein